MQPPTIPKDYQSVKATLKWYATILSTILGLPFYIFFIPDVHREALNSIFGRIPSSPIVGSGIILLLFGFFGWLLIFFFEIHDKVYDRHFIKWRFYYDLDFLLPTLIRPLIHKIDPGFFRLAQENKDEVMKPYYEFVGDYAKHKINENLIVRFYEAVIKYWVTQINELVILFSQLVTFIYYFVYRRLSLPLDTIVITNFIIALLFIANRYFVGKTREGVRLKTLDEIEDIHRRFIGQLDEELALLHQKFGLEYRKSDGEKSKV